MTIEFIRNTQPFLDGNIMSILLGNSDSFNLENLENIDRNTEKDNFFNVLEDGRRVGFVFFVYGEEGIEISLGKTQDECRGFLKKVLLELDNIKPLLPSEWFDTNDSNHRQYWLGVIQDTNPALEYIKQVNLECGFEEYDLEENEQDDAFYLEYLKRNSSNPEIQSMPDTSQFGRNYYFRKRII